MIWLAWQTLRFRWQAFIGTLIALTLGVCLLATTLLCIGGTYPGGNPQTDWLHSVAITLLGNAAGVSGAAAIFVVTGTFAFAVAQRRQEFAILRAVGATPRQIRRLVMGESLFVGIIAAVVGCALSLVAAPLFAAWMASVELAPPGFTPTITWWALAAAAAVGLVSAWVSAWAAARRAGAVRPTEALAVVAYDARVMTPLRWLGGIGFLGGAALLLPVIMDADAGIRAAYIMLEIILLFCGVMMVIPVGVPVLVWLLSLPFRTVVGQLAYANLTANVRRTSSTIAPIFITLSLGVASFSSVATLAETRHQALQNRVTAPLVITSEHGLTPDDITALRQAAPGATIVPVAQDSLLLAQGSDRNSDMLPVWYTTAALGDVTNLPVVAGTIASLSEPAMFVAGEKTTKARGWQLGDTVQLWRQDGSAVPLRLGAILHDSDDFGATVLVAALERQQAERFTVAYVDTKGATPAALRETLAPVAQARGARLTDTPLFLSEQNAQDTRIDQVALLTVVGLALFYTALSIANTCIMAIAGRYREFACLRLGGGTKKQVVGMVFIETFLTVSVAAVGAVLVTTAALVITSASAVAPILVIPWGEIAAIGVACFGIALVTSLVSTVWAFRTPAIRLAAARE